MAAPVAPIRVHPNPVVGALARAAIAFGTAAATAGVVAAGYVQWAEPRLFTFPELVPPDEGLVWAFLPAMVLVGIAGTLAWCRRSALLSIEVHLHGWKLQYVRPGDRRSRELPTRELAESFVRRSTWRSFPALATPHGAIPLGPLYPELERWLARSLDPCVRDAGPGPAGAADPGA